MGEFSISPPRSVRVLGPPSFSPLGILRRLWESPRYFDLLLTLSLHRIKVRYKQSVLGLAWALMQPLALMLIYTVIFSVVTKMPGAGQAYPVFVFASLLPWLFFSTALTGAANSLVAHQYLIAKVYFPREILPITYVIASFFDFLVASALLGLLMAWYRVWPTWQLLWVAPVMGVAVVFALGLSLLLAALQVSFRDIGLALPLALQIWMFACPVVYPLSAVPAAYRSWYLLNPMAGIVENFRRTVLQGLPPDWGSLGVACWMTAILFPIAYAYFKYREATMADVI
jgi:lipopolysaccharide transport system permease protein